LPPTGDYFGNQAIELAGIIVRPDLQKHRLGTRLVSTFIGEEQPSRLVAYTRNPALLRAVGFACGRADVLDYQDPSALTGTIPNATLEEDGYLYHRGRYGAQGLYGSFDPATRDYLGVPLQERCALLSEAANALAISVETGVN
jgi:hypothetical protein